MCGCCSAPTAKMRTITITETQCNNFHISERTHMGSFPQDGEKIAEKLDFGPTNNFLKNRKENARTKTKVFLDWNGHNLFRTIEKT